MKKFLVTIAVLGFGFSAQADHHKEIQINGTMGGAPGALAGGTSGGIQLNDDDTSPTGESNNPWSIGAQVYKSMTDKFQLGGLINISDADTANSDTAFRIGILGRYNLDTELRDSMFFDGGVSYGDLGDSDNIALHLGFGKRYALSDNITYTPNLAVTMNVGGDIDEGTQITFNLLSFSGFM